MAFYPGASSTSANVSSTAEKDVEVTDSPPDSISSLSFCPVADFLAVGCWDNNVRIYEVGANGQTQGKAMYGHQALCFQFAGISKVISGGGDNAARLYDIQTGQSQQVAQHDAPVKVVKWLETPQGSILVTGSWDKTIKYWDMRTANPVSTVQLLERCYTLDVSYPLMVVGTAERHVQIFNLTNPTTPYKTMPSPLKWQTRVISCFPNSTGFAMGSVEGRVAIQYVDEKDSQNNFSFKCHRRDQSPASKDQSLVYAVNDINFHPIHGTFSTCGSDGTINFWDKDSRTRLKSIYLRPMSRSGSSSAFNRSGTIFAYTVSYDWSKGHSGNTPGHPNKIMLHAIKDDEVKKRAQKR
ncbi:Poly(A)+ RNA export protein [Multifurca ochricompacta]|uniref:Poly(A)+ RNA export protein n=1 Tax=Multifurca ochricompacta TaxID=376703 RepID=A0AAD4LXS8_9AGAM|nr:Poly(A)+ RNA export protein [Multifurca ochricompacta]